MIGAKIFSDSRLFFSLRFRSCEVSIGVSESAAAVETIITILILHPSWRNISPASPGIIVSGRKTASIVSVEATTEIPTSLVACTAACLG